MTNPQPKIVELVANLPLIDKDGPWLEAISNRYNNHYPTLEEIWQLMDEVWDDLGCDSQVMDERVTAFYQHPVWLLNGLFIEQHDLSLENRRNFVSWVAAQNPKRVADYGGGYGTLARMIGVTCPGAEVEVIEPHPHPAAIKCAAATENVRYQTELTGEYDVLIATDVFEHVLDPLSLVEATAHHLRLNGRYLIANCFWPVIKCHLPQTFHFRYSWDSTLAAMGLSPQERVAYGRAFNRQGDLVVESARVTERRSQLIFLWLERLPKRLRHRLARAIWSS
ncbi:methyltransferase domain-containing protein [Desulfobulbus rhabdoformis]|uniref:class I SAM-dependent methyltransferase n=1 Tax=Desulfobulbus rhabdoformis TaxID=34032 RepID=UPI0019631F3E|nr:methyltransferase domain-containing protein [Desulfobulbus rhabdoformis]MBM9614404.1 methyltransferase domain-containing protein [Desulfobulbus rhabdoformis]